MSFFPGKDPQGGRRLCVRRHRPGDRAAHGRSRRLHRAPRAALGALAHGRPLHLLRPFRPGGIPRRRRHRRAPASAYRARHRHLSVRRRDRAPRLPRHRGGDQAGRSQLDDGRARHRAFRAHGRGVARHRQPDPRPADVGGAAEGQRGNGRRLCPSRDGRISGGTGERQKRARGGRLALWRVLAGAGRARDHLRRRAPEGRVHAADRCRPRRARGLCDRRPDRYFRRQIRGRAACWCSSPATR